MVVMVDVAGVHWMCEWSNHLHLQGTSAMMRSSLLSGVHAHLFTSAHGSHHWERAIATYLKEVCCFKRRT